MSVNLSVIMYTISNSEIASLGEINDIESLTLNLDYVNKNSFEMKCPITQENLDRLKIGNLVYFGDATCIIRIVEKSYDDDGMPHLTVKGNGLESLLSDRLIYDAINLVSSNKNYAEIIAYIVDTIIVNGTTGYSYPLFDNSELIGSCGDLQKISVYQSTEKSIFDEIYNIASAYDLRFKIVLNISTNRLRLVVYKGYDYATNNEVVISTDSSNISESDYYKNLESYKNTALVLGTYSNAIVSTIVSRSSTAKTGFDRREIFVDATSVSDKYEDSSGIEQTYTSEEYISLIQQKGYEALADYDEVQSFSIRLRTSDSDQFKYGEDFMLGDIVKIYDEVIGVSLSALVSGVSRTYEGDTFEEIISFGYKMPTLSQKIKQLVK